MIDKTEKEVPLEVDKGEKPTFSFARVWHAEGDALDELSEATDVPTNESDSWAQTLAKIATERAQAKAVEVSGRGARRKAAQAKVGLQCL